MILSDPLPGERVSSFYRISPLAVPVAAKRRRNPWWVSHGFTMNFKGKDMEIAQDQVGFGMILGDFVIHGTIIGLAKCG